MFCGKVEKMFHGIKTTVFGAKSYKSSLKNGVFYKHKSWINFGITI